MQYLNVLKNHRSGSGVLKLLKAVSAALFLLASSSAFSETLRYTGIIKVKNIAIPAKATYEVLDHMPEPKIQIKYEISGKEYLSVYMSGFGDKFNLTADSIEVYNSSPDKKQNYHFSGKQASWLEYSTY